MYTCENVTLKAGDRIDLETNQGTAGIKYCQDILPGRSHMMPMVVAPSLCIAVAADGSSLELDGCTNSSAAQQFELPAVDDKRGALEVTHIASGKCLTGQANGVVGLAKCQPDQNEYEPEALEQSKMWCFLGSSPSISLTWSITAQSGFWGRPAGCASARAA